MSFGSKWSFRGALCSAALVAGAAMAQAPVVVNGRALDAHTQQAIAAMTGVAPQPGRYWYDALTGAYGYEGQATAGFIPPGLALGPLSPQASGGGDGRFGGVFINGRELHPLDIAGLQSLIGTVVPGRYWVDAQGNFGYEHGPPLGNLRAIAQQHGGGNVRGSKPSTCGSDPICQNRTSWLGNNAFSDGATGCIVMDGEITC